MSRLRWIVIGMLGGAVYSWLVTFTFARTYAIAWPEWYRVFAEEQQSLAVRLWEIAVWLPAIPIALLVAFMLTKVIHKAALAAAIVGAVVTLLYAVFSSSGNAWVHVSTFIVAGLLPLSVFVLELHNKSVLMRMKSVKNLGTIAVVLILLPLPLYWVSRTASGLPALEYLAILSSVAGFLLAIVAVIYWVVLYRAKMRNRSGLNM